MGIIKQKRKKRDYSIFSLFFFFFMKQVVFVATKVSRFFHLTHTIKKKTYSHFDVSVYKWGYICMQREREREQARGEGGRERMVRLLPIWTSF
jgi:hypothetical protein